MGIKSAIIKNYARRVTRNTAQWSNHPLESQEKMMKLLVNKASLTQFGKEHHFHKIVTHYDFSHHIPIHHEINLSSYVEEIQKGIKDVLWPGKPRCFVQDVNSKAGLIPVTKESISGYFDGLKMLLFNQYDWMDKHKVFKGKAMFLSNPNAGKKDSSIPIVKLDWLYTQKVPAWLKGNIIWAENLNKNILPEDIRLIVGSPEKLIHLKSQLREEKGHRHLQESFPNLSTVVMMVDHPEQLSKMTELVTEQGIAFLQMYVSSLGCWAFQDRMSMGDCLLNVNNGLFFEFLPLDEKESAVRLPLGEVVRGNSYKLIISNNAGCWAVDSALIVRVTNKNPYRIELLEAE